MRVLDVGEIVRVDGPKGGPSKIFSSANDKGNTDHHLL